MGELYGGLYRSFDAQLPESLDWAAYLATGAAVIFTLINAFMVLTMLYTYMERRLIGRFQNRLGPNRVGPFGLLQPVADAIKVITKEDVIPAGADRWVFTLAPVLMLVPVILVLGVLPFGPQSFLADLNVGILYVLAVMGISTLAMFMAGWASGNRYAMFGAVRAVAQLISYEVPVVLAVAGVVLMAESLSLVEIVEKQRLPFLVLQPLGFLVFFLGSSAELNRTPFDLLEADSEIVAGYHTEYSGMKYGLFTMAEFGGVLTTSGIMATLFLKGWKGPDPEVLSPLWFLIKVFALAFVFIWIRSTLPRLRVDQVMSFAWKFLFPLSLINLVVTAGELLLPIWGTEPVRTAELWLMALVNLGVAVVSVALFSRLIRERRPGPAPGIEVPSLLAEVS